MNKYNKFYIFSLILYIVVVMVHLSGYLTNILYLFAWVLWMPVIALTVVTVFDIKNNYAKVTLEFKKNTRFKSFLFVLCVISCVYTVYNMIACFMMISGIDDISMKDELYYAIVDGVEKQISYDEYTKYSLVGFRMLSGHMIAFVGLCLYYYKSRKLSLNS